MTLRPRFIYTVLSLTLLTCLCTFSQTPDPLTLRYSLARGWNYIALPLQPVKSDPESFFGGLATGAIWAYANGAYRPVDQLESVGAYAVYLRAPTTIDRIFTAGAGQVPIPVLGWNLIAPKSRVGPIAGGMGATWTLMNGRYSQNIGDLQPGAVYWVFLDALDNPNLGALTDDTDGDQNPDFWEAAWGFRIDSDTDAFLDDDLDTVNNHAEFTAGTNPRMADTDSDSVDDDRELLYSSDPLDGQSVPVPAIAAALSNDTGVNSLDAYTADADITGAVDDAIDVVAFRAGLNDTPFADYTDVFENLQSAGDFNVSAADLAQINGGTLPDGAYTVHLAAADALGAFTGLTDLSFTLDATPPVMPFVSLTKVTDSPPIGDRATVFPTASLRGVTEPFSNVEVVEGGAATMADDQGAFTLNNVAVGLGNNAFTVRSTDRAGNIGETQTTILRRPGTPLLEADFVSEYHQDIDIGLASGRRLIGFDVHVTTDTSDTTAALEDVFSVYLVDPADVSSTLLDRGIPGTSLFTIAGDRVEAVDGLVTYNGSRVEIDVTSLGHLATGRLLFQLINSDDDSGTVVVVGDVANVVTGGKPGQPFAVPAATAPGAAISVDALGPVGALRARFGNVRVDTVTGVYHADLRVENTAAVSSSSAAFTTIAVVLSGLTDGVTVTNASGISASGAPYINLSERLPSGGLQPNQRSESIHVEIANPGLLGFSLRPTILAGAANTAPQFNAFTPFNVFTGGYLEIPLTFVDADGDNVQFRIASDGVLPRGRIQEDRIIFEPLPGDEGAYTFDVVADDGAQEIRQTISVTIEADPATTTRLSGHVLNVLQEPLSGVVVSLGHVTMQTDVNGRFELDNGSAAPFAAETLHVAPGTINGAFYPTVAEKLQLLLGRIVTPGINNVIGRPIYLPALDIANASPIVPGMDVTVSVALNPDELPVEVFVAADTLTEQNGAPYTGNLSVTEVPPKLTPAALPDGLLPALVVTIQPGEMVFTTPAPITLPNRMGYPPGTQMTIWSINPFTGDFDDVGTAVVSADGSVIETLSGGIRNSSWHFAVQTEDADASDGGDDNGSDESCNSCQAGGPGTSDIILHSGALVETHDLVPYFSLGETRQLRLTYDSLHADARPILHINYGNLVAGTPGAVITARLSITRGDFGIWVPQPYLGHPLDLPEILIRPGYHFWAYQAGSVNIAMQADLRGQPSGIYQYQFSTGRGRYSDGPASVRQPDGQFAVERVIRFDGTTSRIRGEIMHINTISSPFGAGWSLNVAEHVIENPDDSVLLLRGGQTSWRFKLSDDGYQSPPGDFSVLERMPDNTFQRTLRDQTIYTFNADNKLASITDRNNNITMFTYNGNGQLTTITDPVGLQTTLSYTDDKVTAITDPASRVTAFDYDNAGDLVRITDPDGSQRVFQYDDDHHMTGEITRRGNTPSAADEGLSFHERAYYDFAGRVTGATLSDGSTISVRPAAVRGLYPPEITGDLLNLDRLPVVTDEGPTMAIYRDPNGNIQQTALDEFGQNTDTEDAEGPRVTVTRNANNRITGIADGDGTTTLFEYDERGNLIRVLDDLAIPENQFTGAVDANWHEPGNWSAGIVPGSNDTVILGLDGVTRTIQVNADITVGTVILGGAVGTQTIVLNSGSLTVASGLTINSSGVLDFREGALYAGGIVNSGLIRWRHTDTFGANSTRTANVNGSITNCIGGRIEINAGLNDRVVLAITGTVTNAGMIELTSNRASGSPDIQADGQLINETQGDILCAFGAGGGTRYISAELVNRGTIEVEQFLILSREDAGHRNTGTIILEQSSFQVSQSGSGIPGPSFTNIGNIEIGDGLSVTVSGGDFIQQTGATIAGGTVRFRNATGTFPADVAYSTSWILENGHISGPGTLTSRASIIVDDAGSIAMDVVNLGLIAFTGGDDLSASTTFAFTIDGDFVNGEPSPISGAVMRASGGENDTADVRVTGAMTNHGLVELTQFHPSGTGAGKITVLGGPLINEIDGVIRTISNQGGGSGSIAGRLDSRGHIDARRSLVVATTDDVSTNSGTINVTGGLFKIDHAGTDPGFVNTGSITVIAPAAMEIEEGAFSQNGVLTGDGNVTFDRCVANYAAAAPMDSTYTAITATISTPDTFTINGSLLLRGSCTVNADVVNLGTFSYRDGDGSSFATTFTALVNGSFVNGAEGGDSDAVLRVSAERNDTADLRISGTLTNHDRIELTQHSTLEPGVSWISVLGGPLVNEADGIIQTIPTARGGARGITAEFDNRGTVDGQQGLRLNIVDNVGANSGTITITGELFKLDHAGADPGFTNSGVITTSSPGAMEIEEGFYEQTETGMLDGDGNVTFDRCLAQFADLALNGASTVNAAALTVDTLTINASLQMLGASTIDGDVVNLGSFIYRAGDTFSAAATFNAAVTGSMINGQVGGSVAVLRIEAGRSDTAQLTVGGPVTNHGSVELAAFSGNGNPQLIVSGSAFVNEVDGAIHSLAALGGSRSISATIDNRGAIDLSEYSLDCSGLTNSAAVTVGPGHVLNVTGVMFQTAAGLIGVTIGGTNIQDIGRCTVGGTASLDGTLELTLADGLVVNENDGYEVMTWNAVAGVFTAITGTDIGSGLELQPAYNDQDLTFTAVSATGAGATAVVVSDASKPGTADAFKMLGMSPSAMPCAKRFGVRRLGAALKQSGPMRPPPEDVKAASSRRTPESLRLKRYPQDGRDSVIGFAHPGDHLRQEGTEKAEGAVQASTLANSAETLSMAIRPASGEAAAPQIAVEDEAPLLGRTFTWDPAFNQLSSIVDEAGNLTRFEIDPANGDTLSYIRVVGMPDSESAETDDVITRWTYTGQGQLETETDALGRVTRNVYDAFGRLTKEILAEATADEAERLYEYDTAGRVTGMVDELGNRTEFEYDAMNRVTRVTSPSPGGAAAAPVREMAYDAGGNVVSSVAADGTTMSFRYDSRDRLVETTDDAGNTTFYGYDANDNRLSRTSVEAKSIELEYDARSQLKMVTDENGAVTSFTYHANGDVSAITDPLGNRSEFTTNPRNKVIVERDHSGAEIRRIYNVLGNLASVTDRTGRVTRYEYDTLNRRTKETWLGENETEVNVLHYSYDTFGNVTALTDNDSTVTITYDARNRVINETNAGSPGAPQVQIAYTYDDAGNLTAITETINGQPGAVQTFTYDDANRIAGTIETGGFTPKRVDFVYDVQDRIQSLARFADAAGATAAAQSDYARDQLGRLVSITHTDGAGQQTASYDYVFSADDRISQISDIDGVSAFTYDARGQIVDAVHTSSQKPQETYTYDANGNRTSSYLHASGYAVGVQNRLDTDGAFNYTHDADGRLISRTTIADNTTRTFVYDHRDRLVEVVDSHNGGADTQRTGFIYDGFDRRIRRTHTDESGVTTTHFIYANGVPRLEFSDVATLRTRNFFGITVDSILATDTGGDVLWHLSDHLGSTRDLADASGQILNHICYDAFGRLVSESDPRRTTRFLFNAREYDAVLGWYDLKARYFDPSTGRFTTEDPIRFAGGDANLYRYVGNEPIRLSDPTGTDSVVYEPLPGGAAGFQIRLVPDEDEPPPPEEVVQTPTQPLEPADMNAEQVQEALEGFRQAEREATKRQDSPLSRSTARADFFKSLFPQRFEDNEGKGMRKLDNANKILNELVERLSILKNGEADFKETEYEIPDDAAFGAGWSLLNKLIGGEKKYQQKIMDCGGPRG